MGSAVSRLGLDPLVHFHFIAKHQSLRKAAQALHLSAPALTHSLNKLERDLGVALCHRSKAGFRLTEHGKSLANRAEIIVSEMSDYLASLQDSKRYSGILSIGVLDHFENPRLEQAIERTVKEFPDLKLNISVMNSDEISRGVSSGDLDVGFGIFHQKLNHLRYVPIGEDRMRYYVSDKHPLWKKEVHSKEDLYGHKVAWIDSQSRNLANLESEVFCDHPNYKMNVAAFSNSLDGALKILLSGHAVVPLSPSFAERFKGKARIKELKVQTNSRILPAYCVYHPKRRHSPPARRVIDNIVKSAE